MALFQAYLVQGTAWRSVTLQDVRQNRRLPPRMGTEFGCSICNCVQTVCDSNCFGFVFYVLRSENEFCLYVHLLTVWSNGWKFRNSLPISKSVRCGSA